MAGTPIKLVEHLIGDYEPQTGAEGLNVIKGRIANPTLAQVCWKYRYELHSGQRAPHLDTRIVAAIDQLSAPDCKSSPSQVTRATS